MPGPRAQTGAGCAVCSSSPPHAARGVDDEEDGGDTPFAALLLAVMVFQCVVRFSRDSTYKNAPGAHKTNSRTSDQLGGGSCRKEVTVLMNCCHMFDGDGDVGGGSGSV